MICHGCPLYFSLLTQQLHPKRRVIQILVSMAESAKKQGSTRTLIVFALILGLKEGSVTVSNATAWSKWRTFIWSEMSRIKCTWYQKRAFHVDSSHFHYTDSLPHAQSVEVWQVLVGKFKIPLGHKQGRPFTWIFKNLKACKVSVKKVQVG